MEEFYTGWPAVQLYHCTHDIVDILVKIDAFQPFNSIELNDETMKAANGSLKISHWIIVEKQFHPHRIVESDPLLLAILVQILMISLKG